MDKRIVLTIIIWCITVLHTVAQTIVVKGMIINEGLLPLPGAVIQTEDKKYYSLADDNGKYRLELPVQYNQLQIHFVGYGSEIVLLTQKDTIINRVLIRPKEEGFMTQRELQKENKRIEKLYKKAEKIFKE